MDAETESGSSLSFAHRSSRDFERNGNLALHTFAKRCVAAQKILKRQGIEEVLQQGLGQLPKGLQIAFWMVQAGGF